MLGFGVGFIAYSHEAPNTTIDPGTIKKLKVVPKNISERKMSIAVAIAVTRHLTIALASASSLGFSGASDGRSRILALLHCVYSEANQHIIYNDQDGM